MSMVKCRECGKDISDEARACPHCGCPSEEQVKIQEVEDTNARNRRIGCAIVGIIAAIIGFLLMFDGTRGMA